MWFVGIFAVFGLCKETTKKAIIVAVFGLDVRSRGVKVAYGGVLLREGVLGLLPEESGEDGLFLQISTVGGAMGCVASPIIKMVGRCFVTIER